MADSVATPAARKRAAASTPAAPPADRSPSRYVVGEVVPTNDGVWIRLIDTVPANGRHAAVKAVVGTREGRWFVCAESNSEVVTYGPPPDPTPTLVATQSVSDVLGEPPIALPLPLDPDGNPHIHPEPWRTDDQRPGLHDDLPIVEGEPIPLDEPAVDASQAREGQPIPIDPDEDAL